MNHKLQVELWLDAAHENHGKHDADALKEIFAPIFTDNHAEQVASFGLYGTDSEIFIMQVDATDEMFALFQKNRKGMLDIFGSKFNWDDYGVVRIEIEDFEVMQELLIKTLEDMSWD